MGDVLSGILDELCVRADMLFMLLVVEFLFLGLSLVGLFYVDSGSAAFVVWLLNIAGLVVLAAFSGTTLAICHRRV